MKKHLILLDVDGVINPFGRVDEEFIQVDLDWETLTIPKRIISYIETALKSSTIIWSTSWVNLSLKISEELNLNINEYLSFPSISNDNWFKESTIINFIKKHKWDKILIIDDEIPNDSIVNKFKNVTILKTNPIKGLTENDFNKIKKWLNS